MEVVRIALAVVLVVGGGIAVHQSLVNRETVCVVFEDESGNTTVTATVSDNPLLRLVGLSFRDDLTEEEGMLFEFRREAERTFVMRGMSFGIDIVFIGEGGTVTAVYEAAPPTEADGKQEFTSTAKYVVEVPRGFAEANDIGAGDEVVINPGCKGRKAEG